MRWVQKFTTAMALANFLLIPGVSAADPDIIKYIKVDSAFVYSWNNTESEWIPNSVQLFKYNDGKTIRILTLNYNTRSQLSKAEYSYDTAGFVDTITYYAFNEDWKALTRNVFFYDHKQRITEIWIQKYLNSVWVDDRIQNNYVYDEFDRLLEFQSIYWRNNMWTQPTIDYSYYDEQGKLIRREAFYSNGSLDYQVICNYDGANLASEMYAQYPSATGWMNWWLVNYQYDDCGYKISQVQYTGSGSEWIPNTKTVSFAYFKPELYPDRRVAVCHHGKTLTIRTTAVQEHLDHGDCLGPCPGSEGSGTENNGSITTIFQGPPFTVYPNPASEQLTVALNKGEESGYTKIELLDFRGNILRTINTAGEKQIWISRDGLASGQYFLRIYADEVYNLMVIFR